MYIKFLNNDFRSVNTVRVLIKTLLVVTKLNTHYAAAIKRRLINMHFNVVYLKHKISTFASHCIIIKNTRKSEMFTWNNSTYSYFLHYCFIVCIVCFLLDFSVCLSGCCIPSVPLTSLPDLLLLPTNDFSLGLGGVLNGWHPNHPSDPGQPKVSLLDTSPRRRKKTVRFDGPQTKDSGIDTSSTFTSSEDSNSAPKVTLLTLLGASL